MKFDGDMNAFQTRFTDWFKIAAKAEEALKLSDTSIPKAVSLASEITHVATRADALCKIARKGSAKDPETARSVFEKCMTAISDVKIPIDAIAPLLSAAEAAQALKLKEPAIEAFSKALVGVAEAYSQESNSEIQNIVLREYWPSVQAGRVIAYSAGKSLGPDAELLLRDVSNPDISVLCRIEMALALLGQPNSVHHMSFRFTKTN